MNFGYKGMLSISSLSKVGGGGSLRGALVALGVLATAAGGALGVAVLIGGAAGAVASVAMT